MISPDLLERLRCPLDPKTARLEQTDEGLACLRCRLVYTVREGIACLLPEEATLPPGCSSLDDLPCRKGAKP
jgi:uncharacterized protein YbaR (Trm112 family)